MKRVLFLLLLLCFFGCASTQPRVETAIQAACAMAPAAQSVNNVICSLLKGSAREKCLKQKRIADQALNAIVNIGAAVIGACQIK